ncbi:hypothetical protein LG288_08215 [Idiomarina seosinensis]|uniref:hypothetical protein n=1 Tax=Idiomarina seosinensis TaxID=281739 RepID=UPI00384B29D0
MANFDAMVPLIPKDSRIPIEQNRDSLRIHQVQRAQAIEKIKEEESNSITERDERSQHHQQMQHNQQQNEQGQSAAEPESEGQDSDGHIDTYA